MASKTDRRCRDCRVHTTRLNEYYMVMDEVWAEAGCSTQFGWGMLCIGCLEGRLGRELTADDFTDCYVNSLWPKSARLIDRHSRKTLDIHAQA